MKIQIIGYSGSGKSTLAKTLAAHYQIPCLHLDNVQFYDNWKERTLEEENEIVQQFLDKNEAWVIDGNYSKVCPSRFKDCDMCIRLDYNRFFCLVSAYKRYLKHKGTIRESCNSPEKFDWEFFMWIVKDGRNKQHMEQQQHNLEQCKGTKLTFKNRKQLNQWLKENKIELLIAKG